MLTFNLWRLCMTQAQIARLQNDSKELETFARQMKKEGRTDLVEKIRAKKRHVDEHIEKYTDKAA
tara:strand:+ start:481 stop:675 length:195 start_codon:yes stop_codon:yes gene_type:complete